MHVSLTDALRCPRCATEYGLILLPEEVRDRRVITGALGCADCQTRYPIERGIADLRVADGQASGGAAEAVGEPDEEAEHADTDATAYRLAALLGLTHPGGFVILAGAAASAAGALAALVDGLEVVATTGAVAADAEPGVSRLRVSGGLPFRSASARGAALTGSAVSMLEEAARVVGAGGRVVVEPAAADARARLESAGYRTVAEEAGTLVVARRAP